MSRQLNPGILTLHSIKEGADTFYFTGTQRKSGFFYHYSTSTAGHPDVGGNTDNEQKISKKVKEASPEECDQAVEGLSSVKAKAKAKQLQETQKDAKSMLQKVWAMLLGIGPALRAVASMSR